MPPQRLSIEQQAKFNQALSIHRAGNTAEAHALYITLRGEAPNAPEIPAMLGAAECQLGRPEAGLACFDAALEIWAEQPNVLQNRGHALSDLRRFDEAVASYDASLKLRADNPNAWFSRGNALKDLGRAEEAVASYDRALALIPGHPEALNNKGNVLHALRRLEDSVAQFDKALVSRPDFPWLRSHALHMAMHIARWDDFETRRDDLEARILKGEQVAAPMHVLALSDQPEVQLKAARTFAAERHPARHLLADKPRRRRGSRIRIGYFSTDFRDHPMAHLMAGVLEHHDRSRFDVFAFALDNATPEAWRKRIAKGAEHFVEAGGLSDLDVTRKARDLGLDIAIDLNGFTQDARTNIFAERAAPVQVNYLGYLGSMGADYYDYLIADAVIIPPGQDASYAERIVRLPSFQANDDKIAASADMTRAKAGLPEKGFVFSAFHQTFKVTPDVFAAWMRILKRVPDSVLWLFAETEPARRNLAAVAKAHGVASDRLIFAGRVPLADHVARQALAGLFLDTHPYNAGATASPALRAGVPVLTRIGQAYAGRMGASLLTAVGLPEMITDTVEAYENLAVELATNPARLEEIRTKLTANLPESLLFDTTRFTRSLEAAFEVMHDRARDGLPPEDIAIET